MCTFRGTVTSAAMVAVVLLAVAPGNASEAEQPTKRSTWLPTPTSYTQIRYTSRDPGGDAWAIRRLKLMLDGGRKDRAHYHVQLIYKANNGSRTDDHVYLQDAFFAFRAGRVRWTVGQFKPPFGLERFQPDRRLDFVERTEVTNRLIVNGRLGESFVRDRGVEADLGGAPWTLSLGLFHGGGANMASHGNGPLEVARLRFHRRGDIGALPWSWQAGAATSNRRADDLDLGGPLKGLERERTRHFAGTDRRAELFVQGSLGKFRGQAEAFRAWFRPQSGASWAAQGAYGQLGYLPVPDLVLALRAEWMTPDRDRVVPSVHNWTAAVVCDLPSVPVRIATDHAWRVGGSGGPARTWRFQVQWVFLGSAPPTH